MSNLIITVISIALVAVLALAGAWYGGNALTASNAKSRATAVAEQAKQITSAWAVYANDRGGSYDLPNVGVGGAHKPSILFSNPDLVPAYLSSWPILPRDIALAGGTWFDGKTNWYTPIYTTSLGAASVSANAIAFRFDNTDFAYEVCRQTTKIFNGVNAEPTPRVPPTVAIIFPANRNVDCFWSDANNNGIFDSGETGATFVYKIY